MTRHLFWDTETTLIQPGLAIPDLICLQYAFDKAAPAIRSHVEDWRDIVHDAAYDPHTIWTGHNQPFDAAVVAAAEPSFVQPIFRMYATKRARDTMLGEQLISIRDGDLEFRSKKKGEFSLAGLAKRYLGLEMNKEDSFRLQYGTLRGRRSAEFPEEALRYALYDVTVLRDVYEAQTSLYRSGDEWMQCAAHFSLHLAQAWGMRTDPELLLKLEAEIRADVALCSRILEEGGFFKDGSVVQSAVKAAVVKACENLGKPVPKTKPTAKQIERWKAGKLTEEPTGNIKYDAETIESIAQAEPNLKRLSQLNTAVGDLGKYIEPMKGGMYAPMNSRPNPIVSTGRTSWSGTRLDVPNPEDPEGPPISVRVGSNLQNVCKRPGVRECFIPRPGHWYCSVDYSTLELRTFAQACLWIVGKSTFAEGFQNDYEWDPHTYMASRLTGLTYAEALEKRKTDPVVKKRRNIGKSLNFSLAGGVGAKRFREMAAADPYNIELTLEECYALKEAWYEAFPEAAPYFEYVNWVVNSGQPQRSFVSRRLRGNVGYTQVANGYFQSLGADAAKRALFAVSMACYAEPKSPLYGSRVVVFVHDEIILEVPIPQAHEASMEVVRLMNRELAAVCPDIPPKSEPTLMTRWIKMAEPKYDPQGRLTAWDLP